MATPLPVDLGPRDDGITTHTMGEAEEIYFRHFVRDPGDLRNTLAFLEKLITEEGFRVIALSRAILAREFVAYKHVGPESNRRVRYFCFQVTGALLSEFGVKEFRMSEDLDRQSSEALLRGLRLITRWSTPDWLREEAKRDNTRPENVA